MWELWNIVYEAIDHLGAPVSNLKCMVSMIMAISALPDVVNGHGEVISSTINAQVFWRELPCFAFYFREVALCKSQGEISLLVSSHLIPEYIDSSTLLSREIFFNLQTESYRHVTNKEPSTRTAYYLGRAAPEVSPR